MIVGEKIPLQYTTGKMHSQEYGYGQGIEIYIATMDGRVAIACPALYNQTKNHALSFLYDDKKKGYFNGFGVQLCIDD